jgi:AcrR family transcriptional regulator
VVVELTQSDQPLVDRAITRSVADRRRSAARDIDRLVQATYRVAERQGSVDPKLRDILEEAELSTEAFYRHFRSKDEMLLVVLGDGRHRLAGYLVHQMDKSADALGRIRAWIRGVLAQAQDPGAAARTRPFLTSLSRLTERFPQEQELSVRSLIELLQTTIDVAAASGQVTTDDPRRDAAAIYRLTVSTMETYVLSGTRPAAADVDHVIGFCLRALGVAAS